MKRFYRSASNKRLAGFCGGIGEQLNIDPVFIRFVFICSFFSPLPVITIYLIAWLLFPLSKEVPIGNIIDQYFSAFSSKNIDKLSELYAEDIVLSEWDANVYKGKQAVLEANKQLFENTKSIRVIVNNTGENNKTSLNEITVYLDNAQKVKVVDSITVVNSKITNIMAYRGF
jgi:phage shock protein C